MLLLECLVDEQRCLREVSGDVVLLHLDGLRFALSLSLLLHQLEPDDLLEQEVVVSLLRKIPEVPHAVFDPVDHLEHWLVSFVLMLFEDLRKDLLYDVGISAVHCELECLFMLVNFEQEWDLLDD